MGKKKRKKSLVGWTTKGWYWYGLLRFNKIGQISIPFIFRREKDWKELNPYRQIQKIRITIEEL